MSSLCDAGARPRRPAAELTPAESTSSIAPSTRGVSRPPGPDPDEEVDVDLDVDFDGDVNLNLAVNGRWLPHRLIFVSIATMLSSSFIPATSRR